MCHLQADWFVSSYRNTAHNRYLYGVLVAAFPNSTLLKPIAHWLMSDKTHHDGFSLSHLLFQFRRIKDTSFKLVCMALVISALPDRILAPSTLCLLHGTPYVWYGGMYYCLCREREAWHFLTRRNARSQFPPFPHVKSNRTPIVCVAVVTVRRDLDSYLEAYIGLLLEGLGERGRELNYTSVHYLLIQSRAYSLAGVRSLIYRLTDSPTT